MDIPTLCLGILSLGDATGYEIKKMVAEGSFSFFSEASFGSIYPALTRLAEEGLVAGTELAQQKRPDKKVYRLTEKCRESLLSALLVPPGADRWRSDFAFLLFMSDLLPRDYVARMIDRRIAEMEQQLAEMDACEHEVTQPGHRFLFEMGRVHFTSLRDYLRDNKQALLESRAKAEALAAKAQTAEALTAETT